MLFLPLLPASILNAALFFLVRSGAKAYRRRWRAFTFDLALVLGLFILAVLLLLTIAHLAATQAQPFSEVRARRLGENLSAFMNWSALLGLPTLAAALFDVVWLEPRRCNN